MTHCNEIPLSCTLSCNENVRRGDMLYHITHECVNRTVDCKNHEFSCPWKGLVTEMPAHLDSCSIEKFRGALDVMTAKMKETELKLKKQIDDLQFEVKNLQLQV
jgi:hypothetical protein